MIRNLKNTLKKTTRHCSNRAGAAAAASLCLVLVPNTGYSGSMTIVGSDAAFDTGSIIWWTNTQLDPTNYFLQSGNFGWLEPGRVIGVASAGLNVSIPSGITYTPLWETWDANHRSSLVGNAIGGFQHQVELNGVTQTASGGPGPVASILAVGTAGFSVNTFALTAWSIGGDIHAVAYGGPDGGAMAADGVLAGFMDYAYSMNEPSTPGGDAGAGSGYSYYGPSGGGGTVAIGSGSTTFNGLGIDSASAYAFSGTGTFVFDSPSAGAAAQISVTGSSSVAHSINVATAVNGKLVATVDADQSLSFAGPLSVNNSAPIMKAGKGTLILPHFNGTGALAIGEGTLKINGDGGVTKVASLSLIPRPVSNGTFSFIPAVLDLKTAGSAVIIDYDTPNPSDPTALSQFGPSSLSPLGKMQPSYNGGPTGLVKMIKDGFGSGDWQGPVQAGDELLPFITSEAAQSDSSLRVGYAESDELFGDSGGTFMGQSVDASAAMIKVTYGGDANLDGMVDAHDLGLLALHWQQPGDWFDGDFNYDGIVDMSDIYIFSLNWLAGFGDPLAAPSFDQALDALSLTSISVPEPCYTTVMTLSSLSFLICRNRRQTKTSFRRFP